MLSKVGGVASPDSVGLIWESENKGTRYELDRDAVIRNGIQAWLPDVYKLDPEGVGGRKLT